ncbi:hypothetical protein [Conexibacter woesei]|uniref:Uncharacterized protein n=1 Tax=Conexibacter woesei (strain DSM 14684 / CCUG 47730 / CIP 108061 / JCM 11494 / NBRC 100937 / ID131577) TaxID=469383 RepID=D3FF23_CONWI|nr:hypothetical protein [Conexibacter woesei]ADB51740.1 hypothetical protein Cwoe_3322 [Conexibacter woesei DSM 14684]
MIKRIVLLIVAAVALACAAAPAAQAVTTLRLDGIGPLRLGMTRTAALDTGWLARRGRGCELGGPPIPITYRLSGPRAPSGVVGVAEFDNGKLRNLSFTRGVRTATGVVAGRTTATAMVNSYRDAGFAARAQFVDTFGGTFVTVKQRGRQVIGGFARGRASARHPLATLGIPYVPTCE